MKKMILRLREAINLKKKKKKGLYHRELKGQYERVWEKSLMPEYRYRAEDEHYLSPLI